ncbi:MAG TPA: DUF3597 domain-containing protein [Xanthobacteraceae bacterium]
MTVLGNIISTIFGHAGAKPSPPPGTGPASPPRPTSSSSSSADHAPAAAAQSAVDIEAVLTKLAGQNKEKLDWRRSIVDLLKLLQLDSSHSARKGLAKELHYTGNTNDSAAMNVWLHKQVMIKLAENGGKVPDSLKV